MVMMNIAKSAVSSVRALLKKKGLKDAVDVTTKKAKAVGAKATAKAKETVEKAKPAVRKATAKAKATGMVARDKAEKAAKKVSEKTPEPVKKAARAVGKGASAVGKAAGTAGLAIGSAGAVGGSALGAATGAVGGKAVRAVGDKIRKIKGKKPRTADQKAFNEMTDTVSGAVGGAAIGGIGALAATGALAASLIKTNQPKESGYTVKRLSDGRFSTTFQDANANAVFSSKQLSPKDIADVRKNVAVLDSIVLGDKITFLEKQEFMARLNYLADKYGVNNITGKNLSVLIPAVGKA
jgi:hypothetical protein